MGCRLIHMAVLCAIAPASLQLSEGSLQPQRGLRNDRHLLSFHHKPSVPNKEMSLKLVPPSLLWQRAETFMCVADTGFWKRST